MSPTSSRSRIGAGERRARRDRLRRSIADQLREILTDRGLTQAALAAATDLDPGHVSRVLRGLDGCSLEALVSLSAGLGADVSVRLFPNGKPPLRDHVQAEMIEALARRLDRRWLATPELPVPAARGFIDLAIRLRGGQLAIACEAHSQLRSIDLVIRRLHEKTVALQALGPAGATSSSLLLLRSTATTRDLVRRHSATFEATFPGRAREAIEALSGDREAWPGPTLLWIRLERDIPEVLERPPRGIRVGR